MSNEGKIKPSKLSYCSSTCVFLVTHHLPHPPYWDIASFQVHSTAFCSCGLCGQRKAFCRRHCEFIHFRPPVPRHGCGERVSESPFHLMWGGDEGNSAQFSSLPFCFVHPKASAMRILFWLSRFPLKALKVGCLVSQHAQLREKWSLWASLSPLSILAALRTQNLRGSWLLANTHPQRTPWSFLPSVLD